MVNNMVSVNPILFINTALSKKEIALISDYNHFSFKKWNENNHDSQNILPFLNQLLAENETNLDAIKGVLVNNGPGPFTSLRIGIAVANTLSYSKKIPIKSMNSIKYFEQGFYQSRYKDHDIFIGLKAWGDYFYFNEYGKDYDPDNVHCFEEIKDRIKDNSIVIGDLKEAVRKEFIARGSEVITDIDDEFKAKAILDYFNQEDNVNDDLIKPVYLRPPKITKSKKLYK